MWHQLDITSDDPQLRVSGAKESRRIFKKIKMIIVTKMSFSIEEIIDTVHATAHKRHLILCLIVDSEPVAYQLNNLKSWTLEILIWINLGIWKYINFQ